jgi:hypothetical protein
LGQELTTPAIDVGTELATPHTTLIAVFVFISAHAYGTPDRAAARCDYGKPHPHATAQFQQFDFFIGDFAITSHAWHNGQRTTARAGPTHVGTAGIDWRSRGRVRTSIVKIEHTVAIGIDLASHGIQRASSRRPQTSVLQIRNAVAIRIRWRRLRCRLADESDNSEKHARFYALARVVARQGSDIKSK